MILHNTFTKIQQRYEIELFFKISVQMSQFFEVKLYLTKHFLQSSKKNSVYFIFQENISQPIDNSLSKQEKIRKYGNVLLAFSDSFLWKIILFKKIY